MRGSDWLRGAATSDTGDHARDPVAELSATLAAQPHTRRGVPLSNQAIRVVLADDHAMLREGLHLMLRSAPDITVIGEAETGEAAVMVAERLKPDVVVLDLEMPGEGGAAALLRLCQMLPDVRVLILTVHAERERLLALLQAGARGYLTKEAASRDLVEAIRVVAAGAVYVRPVAARLLAEAVTPRHTAPTARGRFDALSNREQTVLRFVAQGYSGAEIARKIGVSSKTVDAYKRRVEDKLGLRHRTDYVRFAIEADILGL